MYTIGNMSVNASILYKNQEICVENGLLSLLWLQGSKSVKMLMYLPRYSVYLVHLTPPMTCKGQNQSKCWCTCQGISSALNPSVTARVKISQILMYMYLPTVYLVHLKIWTLSNIRCNKYIYRSKISGLFLTGTNIVWYCWGWSKLQ